MLLFMVLFSSYIRSEFIDLFSLPACSWLLRESIPAHIRGWVSNPLGRKPIHHRPPCTITLTHYLNLKYPEKLQLTPQRKASALSAASLCCLM